MMGKYVTIEGEKIGLEPESTVADVKHHCGAADETVMVYHPDGEEPITLTDNKVVLNHIPNESEVLLRIEPDEDSGEYHVVYRNDRYFPDQDETAEAFKERIGASPNDFLTFESGEGVKRVDNDAVLSKRVPSGSNVSTMAGGEGKVWG